MVAVVRASTSPCRWFTLLRIKPSELDPGHPTGKRLSLTVPISTQLYKRLGTSSGHTCTAVSVASCPRPARQASVRWVARLETRLHLYLQFFSLDGISVHPHYFICQFASELRQYSFSHALEWTKPRHKES